MFLYHGSFVVVKQPKIIESEKGRDFGFAFYLTPDQSQAERMAKRKCRLMKSNKAFVSIYQWDENRPDLAIKEFKKANLEWLEMIINCRSKITYKHGYDIVLGKVADDNVGETVSFVIEGVISKEDAVKRLKFQKINSQIAFCSDKSLKSLAFKGSYEVK